MPHATGESLGIISFKQAIIEVGEWGLENFGTQPILAPFAGLIEEWGEREDAYETSEIIDGYADQLVYLADVCARSGVSIDPDWNDDLRMGENHRQLSALRALAHAVLKNFQGIRGFDNPEKFRSTVHRAALDLFYSINEQFNNDPDLEGCDLAEEFTETWYKVKRRNWVANPTNAHEVVNQEVDRIKAEEPF